MIRTTAARLGRCLLLALVIALLPWMAPAAAAHPLGNFTVNRYARVEVGPETVAVLYILDMAEVPALQERTVLDRNRDGNVAPDEAEAYAAAKAEAIRGKLHLTVNGMPATLEQRQQQIQFPEGQGGLPTLRLEVVYVAAHRGGDLALTFRDDNEPARLGWREIVAGAASGVALLDASVPTADASDQLRRYPDDLLTTPLDVRTLTLRAQAVPGAPGTASPAVAGASASTIAERAGAGGTLTALVTGSDLGPVAIMLALVVAVGLGALHALSPGHGKTMVAAYLVGSRGTALDALILGLTVTVTHTAGVYALGLVTLFATAFVLPERLYPWLNLLSGLLVVAVGVHLLAARLRAAWPGAPLRDHHHHDDHHDHHHGAAHDDAEEHSHPHPHRHVPADGQRVGLRSLVLMGISGGLLPCPSALVLMLSAIALHRTVFGLALVAAFSVGLSVVLVGIGLALVLTSRLLSGIARLPVRPPLLPALVRVTPALGALVVVVAGLAVTAQTLAQFR